MVFQMSLCTNTYPATLEMPCLDAHKDLMCFSCAYIPLMVHSCLPNDKCSQLLLPLSLARKSSRLNLNVLILTCVVLSYTNICTILRHPVLKISRFYIITASFSALTEPIYLDFWGLDLYLQEMFVSWAQSDSWKANIHFHSNFSFNSIYYS